MKISESNRNTAPNSANVSAARGAGLVSEHKEGFRLDGGTGRDDQVEISSLSSQLNAVASESASHASRLIELSSAVSAGRYHVDAQVLSNKIIQEHMRTAA